MSTAEKLRRLFNYDHWANNEVLSVLKEHEAFEYAGTTTSLMSHLVAAQEVWYRRIKELDVTGFEIWPVYSLEEQQRKCKTMFGRWQELIKKHENDLDVVVSYKNSSGTAFDTMLSDILHHVIIHGQHHRAQIAIRLREGGIDPPVTDFIFYTRKN